MIERNDRKPEVNTQLFYEKMTATAVFLAQLPANLVC